VARPSASRSLPLRMETSSGILGPRTSSSPRWSTRSSLIGDQRSILGVLGIVGLVDRYADVNRAGWDERALAQAASPDYAVKRFIDDPDFLSEVVRFDLPRLGNICGLRRVPYSAISTRTRFRWHGWVLA
jgi:hypothetical protein